MVQEVTAIHASEPSKAPFALSSAFGADWRVTHHRFALHRLGPTGLRAIPGYSEYEGTFVTTNYFASR
jgi:hypothetical protein